MSGALARTTSPSRRATRNSFWMSISRRRPASVAGALDAWPHRARSQPSMRRSMSATLPPSRRAAPTAAMTVSDRVRPPPRGWRHRCGPPATPSPGTAGVTRLGHRHGVLGTGRDAAAGDGHGPLEALRPGALRIAERGAVPALVDDDGRSGGDASQVHRDLLDLREGAAHAVGVQDRQAHAGSPGERHHAVGAADLGTHEGPYRRAAEALDLLAQVLALGARGELLDGHRRGAQEAAGHHHPVVGQVVEGRPARRGRSRSMACMAMSVAV